MTLWYPDLADYLAVASEVTGLDLKVLTADFTVTLADSALHAPSAGFGDTEFYPDFVNKAAVLLVRLATNHPLIDGNKRAAWVTLRLFIEMNEWEWTDYPSVDEAEGIVLGVAARELDEAPACGVAAPTHRPSRGRHVAGGPGQSLAYDHYYRLVALETDLMSFVTVAIVRCEFTKLDGDRCGVHFEGDNGNEQRFVANGRGSLPPIVAQVLVEAALDYRDGFWGGAVRKNTAGGNADAERIRPGSKSRVRLAALLLAIARDRGFVRRVTSSGALRDAVFQAYRDARDSGWRDAEPLPDLPSLGRLLDQQVLELPIDLDRKALQAAFAALFEADEEWSSLSSGHSLVRNLPFDRTDRP